MAGSMSTDYSIPVFGVKQTKRLCPPTKKEGEMWSFLLTHTLAGAPFFLLWSNVKDFQLFGHPFSSLRLAESVPRGLTQKTVCFKRPKLCFLS
jgi:hypothetical protein